MAFTILDRGDHFGDVRATFEQIAGQFFLTQIETGGATFSIPVTRSAILEASAKPHSDTSPSGSSAGGN